MPGTLRPLSDTPHHRSWSHKNVDSNGGGFFRRGDGDLMWNPRPLSEPDAAVLRAAAAPLLRDLTAAGKPVPEIRAEAHEDRDGAVCGWIAEPGGYGQGIWVPRDRSPAEQLVELAGQFQDWADEQLDDGGRSSQWPLCPEHGRACQLNQAGPAPRPRYGRRLRRGRGRWCLRTAGCGRAARPRNAGARGWRFSRELCRQDGRARSRSARTASGQSRLQK